MESREILIRNGNCYLEKEGEYILVDDPTQGRGRRYHRIKTPLFHRIACFTSVRRSYRSVIWEFFDQLSNENITGFFTSPEALERATMAVGRPGGHIAFLLGLFCRYYDRLPRNVNMVRATCETCNDNARCGNLARCGNYYGCGDGVLNPLEPGFNLETIPETRRKIEDECFPEPEV